MSSNDHDRRVARTRGRLHGALASLIHERPYEGIVIKEILARADVGRSTFYTHFRDKDDLLDSSIRDLLVAPGGTPPTRGGGSGDAILRCTLRLFEHIERQRTTGRGDPRSQAVVHERVQQELATHIARDLMCARCDAQHPRDLLAQFVASTFLAVLQWWLESRPSLSAKEVNEHLAALIQPALRGSR
jgi:AcrR family transcriptional regulator